MHCNGRGIGYRNTVTRQPAAAKLLTIKIRNYS